ncbi:MAG: hypothetical protein Q9193_002431 [Seirophora villosa]
MPSVETQNLPVAVTQPKSLLLSPASRFRRLITDIQTQLGPNNGITASDAVRLSLQDLLEKYQSDESAWQYCAFRDPSLTFTRNLIDKGNGNFNLVRAIIHFRKRRIIDMSYETVVARMDPGENILKGTLTETRYAWPSTTTPPGPMQITQKANFHRDQVTYMADTLGLHKISNPDPREYAVSLHLYTPPNAAIEGCHVFDSETGKATHVTVYEYYSEYGRKRGI